MAGSSRTLKLSLLADVAGLSKGLTQGSNEVQGFGGKVADFGKKAAVAFAAAAVAATAFAVKFGKDAIVAGEAAATANARIEQINKSMGLFGESTAQVSESLIKYAEQTARLTGVDTNSIKATQAKLLTFKELAATAGELGGNFERTTKAAIDLGAAGFGTAEMNAVALGKALNDPIKGISALTRNGITFTESEKERIKVLVESNKVGEAQNMILQAIETQVGGTAEATANATDRMKVGFTQVKERIGLLLLPILDKFTAFMIDRVFPAFDKYVAPAVQRLVDLFSGESGGLGGSLNNTVGVIKNSVMPIFNGVVKVFDSVKTAIMNNIGSFKEFFDVVKYLAPFIGQIIGSQLMVLGKIAGVVIDIFGKVLGAIKPIINSAINQINLVIRGLNIISPFSDIPYIPLIGDSAGQSGGLSAGLYGSTPALGSASQIANAQAAVAGATSGLTSSMGTGGTGGTTKAPKVSAPRFVTPVGLPALNPALLNYQDSFRTSSMNTYNVTVNGALDSESTARQIVNIINDSQARGTLGAGAFTGAVGF